MMICFTLFMGWSVSSNGQGIRFFEGTFDEALAKAKQEKKLVFVDFYAVVWPLQTDGRKGVHG